MGSEPSTGVGGARSRLLAPDEADGEFWESSLRTANLLNGAILVVDLVYFLFTWSTGPNRPALLVVTLLGLLGFVGGLLAGTAGGELASSAHRVSAFRLWAVAGVGFLVVGVALDGGLSSPLVWLFPLGTLFCALVHPRELVLQQAFTSTAAFAVVAFFDDGFRERPAAVGLHLAYLVAVGFLGARGAGARWRYHGELVALATAVAEMADRDPLTGLANHRVFHERLREELAAAHRSGDPLALLLVDLDRFKDVNDEHGHLVGDAALRVVADVLAGIAREADVAARVGGEEFAVVLRGTDAAGGALVAERIREAVAAVGEPVPLTVSVGVGVFPRDARTAEDLYLLADRAMYRAKEEGRNRVRAA